MGIVALLGIIFLGILITNPDVIAPAVNTNLPADAPSWFPLLFVTIACGAISGFHGLVASGTSSNSARDRSIAVEFRSSITKRAVLR